jgi:hypothetical protein
MRKRAILGVLAAFGLATASPAAEITGTVVSNDPTGRTVVVRTSDGQTLTVRTDQATRVQQGEAVVESTTLTQGVPVRIVTTEVTGEAVADPLATRILVVPSEPAVMEDDDDTDVDIDTDDDDDDDVDIDTDDLD